ncbi:hypothetical protein EDB86DRAFT_3246417 [Lactarius hatsudake]|nr:hypothetical protein EDB86DRAFT_3246417 [Lactarius hatsudake]
MLHISSLDMPLFGLHAIQGAIASLVAPTKQVEERDRRLERAQALFEKHQAEMNPHDRDLAQSLLEYSKDLKVGLETKSLHTQKKQARLYCDQVDKTLQMIQAACEP